MRSSVKTRQSNVGQGGNNFFSRIHGRDPRLCHRVRSSSRERQNQNAAKDTAPAASASLTTVLLVLLFQRCRSVSELEMQSSNTLSRGSSVLSDNIEKSAADSAHDNEKDLLADAGARRLGHAPSCPYVEGSRSKLPVG